MKWESNFRRCLTNKATAETAAIEAGMKGINIQHKRAELKRIRGDKITNTLEEQYKTKSILMQDVDMYVKMLFFTKK